MVAPKSKQYQILIIEDNPGDARLLKEALGDIRSRTSLSIVEDGEEALTYLHKRGKYTEATRPDVIFLDLNLPKKDGREVLAEIKGSRNLRQIPVIILTTSDAEPDVARAYDLHANCYVKKPVDLESFFTVVRSCEGYWLDVVRLPRNVVAPATHSDGRDGFRNSTAGTEPRA